MNHNSHCTSCIRECETGKSFCHRRDEHGGLVHQNTFYTCCFDELFDKPMIYFGANAKVLSIGSWGCNFRCLGCQNAGLSWSESGTGPGFAEMMPLQIVDLAVKNHCKGICYTFNEPAILQESLENIALLAREAGLFNVFVTNSTLTVPSAKRMSGCMDAIAADIKSMQDDFYYSYCGARNIKDVAQKICSCIATFAGMGCHVEVRTNIIPGANDSEENFHGISSWIRDNLGEETPWHITRFFPAHMLSHLPHTTAASMIKAQRIGYEEGLKHVHTFFNKGCDCAKSTETCCKN